MTRFGVEALTIFRSWNSGWRRWGEQLHLNESPRVNVMRPRKLKSSAFYLHIGWWPRRTYSILARFLRWPLRWQNKETMSAGFTKLLQHSHPPMGLCQKWESVPCAVSRRSPLCYRTHRNKCALPRSYSWQFEIRPAHSCHKSDSCRLMKRFTNKLAASFRRSLHFPRLFTDRNISWKIGRVK